MKQFVIYNTLTQKKEEFNPINPPDVRMYVCGITPYSDAHLGHARCYVVFDTLKRYLKYSGYNVKYVQNITDIDDKIINKSRETGDSPEEISSKYFENFKLCMKNLNVEPADEYPKVSESISDIIEFVEGLIKKGMAYNINGNVYFRVAEFNSYGRLSGRKMEELISNQECPVVQKEDERDFAVWKSDTEFGWDSPWGKGRPGWHIECSAMSRKFLGDEFDIHGGGLDLIFPHHENELAQSEALTGRNPVKYWVHNGMVTLKGDKMAKSTGNFFLLKDLLDKYPPMAVRMYLLSSSYRQPLDFSIEGLMGTQKAYDRIAEFKNVVAPFIEPDKSGNYSSKKAVAPFMGLPLEKITEPKEDDEVISALNDDLNTAKAIGEIFKKITPIKEKIFKGIHTTEDINSGKMLIAIFEKILGIQLYIDKDEIEEIESLIKKREDFRRMKDYAQADSIRMELEKMGIELKDTPTGTRWFRKSN